jgi:hypothetical protein
LLQVLPVLDKVALKVKTWFRSLDAGKFKDKDGSGKLEIITASKTSAPVPATGNDSGRANAKVSVARCPFSNARALMVKNTQDPDLNFTDTLHQQLNQQQQMVKLT